MRGVVIIAAVALYARRRTPPEDRMSTAATARPAPGTGRRLLTALGTATPVYVLLATVLIALALTDPGFYEADRFLAFVKRAAPLVILAAASTSSSSAASSTSPSARSSPPAWSSPPSCTPRSPRCTGCSPPSSCWPRAAPPGWSAAW
ncbi:hypothetical protein ACFQVA_33550 [Actinomadura keratinilytica]